MIPSLRENLRYMHVTVHAARSALVRLICMLVLHVCGASIIQGANRAPVYTESIASFQEDSWGNIILITKEIPRQTKS